MLTAIFLQLPFITHANMCHVVALHWIWLAPICAACPDSISCKDDYKPCLAPFDAEALQHSGQKARV